MSIILDPALSLAPDEDLDGDEITEIFEFVHGYDIVQVANNSFTNVYLDEYMEDELWHLEYQHAVRASDTVELSFQISYDMVNWIETPVINIPPDPGNSPDPGPLELVTVALTVPPNSSVRLFWRLVARPVAP